MLNSSFVAFWIWISVLPISAPFFWISIALKLGLRSSLQNSSIPTTTIRLTNYFLPLILDYRGDVDCPRLEKAQCMLAFELLLNLRFKLENEKFLSKAKRLCFTPNDLKSSLVQVFKFPILNLWVEYPKQNTLRIPLKCSLDQKSQELIKVLPYFLVVVRFRCLLFVQEVLLFIRFIQCHRFVKFLCSRHLLFEDNLPLDLSWFDRKCLHIIPIMGSIQMILDGV